MFSQVGENEADLGVPSLACTQARNKVAECSHPARFSPLHWVSKAPDRISPIFTLLGIYNPDCWILILISIGSVTTFLLIAAKVAPNYGGRTEKYDDVVLVPFRLEF